MATRPIKITASNSSTGTLILDDHGHTAACAGDTILWQIGAHSGVDSITAIKEKYGSTNIFSSPPRRQGNNWRGDIAPVVRPNTVYIYSITWVATDGSGSHVFDPIITIKPVEDVAVLARVVTILAAVAGISILFLCRKKRKKQHF